MMRKFLIWGGVVVLLLSAGASEARAPKGGRQAFILLDGAQMAAYKASYQSGHPAETKHVQAAVADAQKALTRDPYTIARKTQTPLSGDNHDHMSQAPYSWPDPAKPDGKPYINRDGLRNLEATAFTDEDNMVDLISDVKKLSVAYYFTGREEYAAQAAKQLHGFFLDPATRMNPNLNFAQAIPGLSMLETRNIMEIPDALALMSGSESVDAKLMSGLQDWFRQFINCALTSPLGLAEGKVDNNHGTFYDSQIVDFALYTGDDALARKVLETQTMALLVTQLQPDGRGQHASVAWLKLYLLKEKQMERADVVPIRNHTASMLYDKAGQHYPDLAADKVFALYPENVRRPWTL